ncbi:MAG: glycosyl transferase family 2 [Bacteroidetes bacterium RIFOXYA12_FULL_35_11]|nr:MAG: glycosyl transferase family 2 [Bacteroidetes bacterium GWF2_35_48]OFY72589.1 MAG: glycosyl transferase family 2 [Bacteroidetes bacterium RIFOXYA12_FULL_35_11]OFY95703.1 MAG: glycosyl transferase family 2 [Bacteroidetes bacterium RIFOXYC12_FULL_35_7]HBX49569.1 glycosyl transferase family 2 [Bacteroidales bacterium]
MTKVAVVILNWNGIKFLKKFIPVLIQHTNSPEYELWVADNGSTDESVKYLKENHPQIRLIEFDKNHGFSSGYNKALFQIDAEYFVLLNSDVEVTENWIDPIINLMDQDDYIAACTPKIKSYDNKEYFEYAGAAGGFIDKFGFPFCRGRILNVIEKDTGQYNKSTEVFWASGACMFVRASLYKSADGLDDDFFAHMEEIDLCWRLKNQGYKIMYCPDVTIYHVGGGTLPNNSPRKLYLNFRNNLLTLYKNLPWFTLLPILFARGLFDAVAALKFLFTLSFPQFWAVLHAHLSFYKLFGTYYKKRNKLKLMVTVNYHPQIYPRSMLIDFFLKNRKNFSQMSFL